MKAPAFEYERADSVTHAAGLLAQSNGDGRILAGGQTLGPMLNLRLAMPRVIVDIGHIRALKTIEDRADTLVIGAGVTHAALEDREDPTSLGRLLAYAGGSIAYRAIRNRGTIGGSLCHADPAADWITIMTLLDAELVIANPSGRRRVKMTQFMVGAYATVLAFNEVLEAVEIRKPSTEARWGYYRVCRKVGEFPEALGAVLLDPAQKVARLVAGAIDRKPALLPELAEQVALRGLEATSIEAAKSALQAADPGMDPIECQRHVVAIHRAVLQAFGR